MHLVAKKIPMTWDFGEVNPFSESGGNFLGNVEFVAKGIRSWVRFKGHVKQMDATAINGKGFVFSTDPPYYDNIGYADLSDFFYVWLRRVLFPIYPDLFSTLMVPKARRANCNTVSFRRQQGESSRVL